jgi:hypothetical protein
MKTILKFTAILLVLAGAIACGKDKEKEMVSLKDTKWKLSGIVNIQTGKLKVLEPRDCEECYTLTFDAEDVACGYSSTNEVLLDISRIPPVFGGTKRGEVGNGRLYWDTWPSVTSYTLKDGKLKFFYTKDNKESYLLFKPYEQ